MGSPSYRPVGSAVRTLAAYQRVGQGARPGVLLGADSLVVPSPFEQLNDPDWLRDQYLERGRTQASIAAEVGCHPEAVARALARHDIRRNLRRLADVPADWLARQYQDEGRSIVDIARELHLSPTSVRRALAEAGIPVDDGRLPAVLDDPDWLAAQADRTNQDIARQLGVGTQAVDAARARHGLRRRRGRRPYPELHDRAWLVDRYTSQGRTQAEIAEEIGCARSAVTVALQRLGIAARPKKGPQYPQLWDHDWLTSRVKAGATPADIAAEVGCRWQAASVALRRAGLR